MIKNRISQFVQNKHLRVAEGCFFAIALLWVTNARHSFFECEKVNELTIILGFLAGGYFLLKNGINAMITRLHDYCIPMLLIVGISSVTAVAIHKLPLSGYVLVSAKRCLVYVAAFLIAYCAVSRFGRWTAVLITVSLALNYSTVIGQYLHSGGMKSILHFMNHSEGGVYLEIENIGACFALLMIYFLFEQDFDFRVRISLAVLAVIVVLFCNKRSIYFECFCALPLYFIMRALPFRKEKNRYFMWAGILILGCFLFLFLIKSRIYSQLVTSLGMNDSKRHILWDYFNSDYSLSPLYWGRTLCYTDTVLKNDALVMRLLSKTKPAAMLLHNDLLRMYIGWGFIPFLGYLINMCLVQPLRVLKSCGKQKAMHLSLYTMFVIFIFFFDNMATQPIYNITFFAVIYLLQRPAEKTGEPEK